MIKNLITYRFLFFTGLLLLGSCEEAYDTDELIENFENKLVVHSYFSADEPWSISVSTNGNRIDPNNNIRKVEDARVTIFDQNGDELYQLFHDENGIYNREGYYPSQQQSYILKVSAKGFPDVVSRSYVPSHSNLHIDSFEEVEVDEEEGVEVSFRIENSSDEEVFYMWEVNDILESSSESGAKDDDNMLLINFLEDLENGDNNNTTIPDLVGNNEFSDGSYSTDYSSINRGVFTTGNDDSDGVSITVLTTDTEVISNVKPNDTDVDFETNLTLVGGGTDGNGPHVELKKYELRVLAISREFFDYYNSIEEHRRLGGASNNSLKDSHIIYTNIDNGLGLFAGYSESVVQF